MSTITLPQGIIPSYSFQSGNDYVVHPNGTTIRNQSTADFAHTINLNGLSKITIKGGLVLDGNGAKADGLTDAYLELVAQNCKRTQADHQAFNAANLSRVTLKLSAINCNWVSIFNGLVQGLLIDGGTLTSCNIHHKASLANGSSIEQRGVLTQMSSAYYQSEFQPANKAQTDQIRISIHDCAMVKPVMGTAALQSNTGGWSVPMEGGYVEILRNYFDGTTSDGRKPVKGGFLGPLMIVELGSRGGMAKANWIQYANDPVSVNTVSQNCNVSDNLIIGCLEPANMQGGAPAGSNIFGQNDSTVLLPSDGAWKLLGLTPPGTATPPPIVTPPIQPNIEARVAALEQWRELMKGANK